MAMTEALTEREQQALEHMHKAQELGITLKEYAARTGLEVQHLYQLRKPLVRKGALGPARRPDAQRRRDQSSAFLPVRVVPSGPAGGGAPMACRLVHPSGWVLECGGLPPASWMAAVLSGGTHAAT
ncbi:MAG TPA: hypothetical protein VGH38_29810 [Bryobacteraceae bacterium]|jgi:hypothetical protein